MEYKIRPYHPSDLCSLYRICIQTLDNGTDASHLYPDPELVGHYFAGAYAVLEPDLCFILTCAGAPCGYVLGTRHSDMFGRRCEEEWFPVLRGRYPMPTPEDDSPSAGMIRAIHHGYRSHPDVVAYPAHLHIDLLPCVVGQGNGRRMMERFLCRLRELNIPAVHLGVAKKNERAIAFYKHMRFHVITEQEWGFFMGMFLDKCKEEK
jgi:ribosomal protein S18 acetylase RimI-like enzyme